MGKRGRDFQKEENDWLTSQANLAYIPAALYSSPAKNRKPLKSLQELCIFCICSKPAHFANNALLDMLPSVIRHSIFTNLVQKSALTPELMESMLVLWSDMSSAAWGDLPLTQKSISQLTNTCGTTLVHLSLRNCNVSDMFLATYLKNCKALKSVDLKGCLEVGDRVCRALAQPGTALEVVNLGLTRVTARGVGDLFRAAMRLRTLKIEKWKVAVADLVAAFGENSNANEDDEVNPSIKKKSKSDTGALVPIERVNIEVLKFRYAAIGNSHCAYLMRRFAACLRELDLSSTLITSLKPLFDFPPLLLRKLNLSSLQIGSGISKLPVFLSKLENLGALYLGNLSLYDSTVKGCLMGLKRLCCLVLTGNKNIRSLHSLLDALGENCQQLIRLDLAGTSLVVDIQSEMDSSLPALEVLSLELTGIDDEVI
ncbi:hypothetical protein HK096_001599 [Nowakowskiella sp. JEL0078]|nr:hypothetical protein HK096_001599 [Nowakowskiella sp. JEL0078]